MSEIGKRVFIDCITHKGYGKIESIIPEEAYHILLEGQEEKGTFYFKRDEFEFVNDEESQMNPLSEKPFSGDNMIEVDDNEV